MRILRRLTVFTKPYWKELTLISFFLLLHTGLVLIPPLLQRQIIDQVI